MLNGRRCRATYDSIEMAFSSGRVELEGVSAKEKDSARTSDIRSASNYVTLDQIPTWNNQVPTFGGRGKNVDYLPDLMLNEKVSLWKGDITRLEVDAIVNSSAADLQHHSATHAVCYAVHAAAGPLLHNECSRLHLGTGNALVTRGYNLPAKYIIHAAGPINGDEAMLQSCYTNCFQLILEHGFRSVAFSCIATGWFEFPKRKGAQIALETTRVWLQKHSQKVDRIIFCVFNEENKHIYAQVLPNYFPAGRRSPRKYINKIDNFLKPSRHREESHHCKVISTDESLLEDEKSKILFQEAIKKGYIISSTVTLLLVGVAGAGKTSFCHLLFDEPPPPIRTSTPVAKSSIRAVSLTKVLIAEIKEVTIWERISSSRLTTLVADGIIEFQTQGLTVKAEETVQPMNANSKLSTEKYPSDSNSAAIQKKSNKESEHTQTSISPGHSSDISKLSKMKHIKQLLRLISDSKGSGEIFRRKWLYIIDSGGQPQFHELLPTFIHHVSAATFFVKLNETLKSHPLIEFYKTGSQCGQSYVSSSNHLQILQNCLQAIQSRNDDNQCPKLLFVGTHHDLESKKESLKSKNKQLLEMLYQHDVFRQNFVYYSMGKSDKLLFPVNAKTPSQADRAVVADFRKILMDRCSTHEHKIPISWFVLEQLLQEHSTNGILSFDKCNEIAQHLGMNTEELHAALKYLMKLNIFLYFPDILPKVVFTTSQVLLNKITELVEYSHDLNNGMCKHVDSADLEFREYGKISVDMLKRKKFSSHYLSGLFEPEDLLYLWVNLLIVATYTTGIAIMPAVLSELSLETLSEHRLDINTSTVIPIVVHYPGGLFPLGIFSSLVSQMQNNSSWKISMQAGKPVCLFKNCVEFTVNGDVVANVTLIYSHRWIELHVYVFSKDKPKVYLLRDAIFNGLVHAQKVQKYTTLVPELAYFCQCEARKQSSLHLATPVTPNNDFMRCRQNERLCTELTEQHQLWLEFLDGNQSHTYEVQEDIDMNQELEELHISPVQLSQDKRAHTKVADRPNLTSKPRLHELDYIKIDGKTVKIIDKVAASWAAVATRLYFEGHEIRSISRDNQCAVDACREVFIQWLDGKGRTPTTWATIIKALEEASFSEVVNDLKKDLEI